MCCESCCGNFRKHCSVAVMPKVDSLMLSAERKCNHYRFKCATLVAKGKAAQCPTAFPAVPAGPCATVAIEWVLPCPPHEVTTDLMCWACVLAAVLAVCMAKLCMAFGTDCAARTALNAPCFDVGLLLDSIAACFWRGVAQLI